MKQIFGIGVLAAFLITAAAGAQVWDSKPCREGCNVILIMVDTLAGEHLKTYGYTRDTMPKTTAFFETGIIFDDASSNAPWTLPSFTGMYLSDVASHITYADLENDSRPSLQSELRANGVTLRAVRPRGDLFIFDGITRFFTPEEITFNPEGSAIDVGEEEIAKLESTGKPYFLLLHTFEVHDPYAPHSPYDSYFDETEAYPVVTVPDLIHVNISDEEPDPEQMEVFRLRYDQGLAQADEHISAFLNALPESVLNDTVIILTSDHGEAFGQHGKVRHGDNGLYQEELRIPLMMRIPDVPARHVADPVSLIDLAPTMLSFFNIPSPDTFIGDNLIPAIQGRSLGERIIPSVTGLPFYLPSASTLLPVPKTLEEAGAQGTAYPIVTPKAFGVRKGDDALFVLLKPEPKLHYFNLASDPEEQNNLAEENDSAVPADLMQALQSLRESAKNPQ